MMEVITNPEDGAFLSALDTQNPTRIEVVKSAKRFDNPSSTYFGYLAEGTASITADDARLRCSAGMYFSVPSLLEVEVDGLLVVIERLGYRGMSSFGKREKSGRLLFIDGCSDSVLAHPPRSGDPVLNHLHVPPHTTQAYHRHSTFRMGCIADGAGVAKGVQYDGAGEEWEANLQKGTLFYLAKHTEHCFVTMSEHLDVIVFHPDSDWGATDEDHPMINRSLMDR